jgi:hypothetical protein
MEVAEEPEVDPDEPAAEAPVTPMRRTSMRARMRRDRTPSGEPGTVVVIATGGWAEVFEGRRRLGRTPARVTLAPGRHTLRLVPFGDGPAVTRTVRVRSGETSNLAVPLSR